jgi:chemotaxis protein methyltransferase CheR
MLAGSEETEIEVELLIEAILRKYQYDFRHYARSSIRRRVAQALGHFHCANVSQLQEKILHDRSVFPHLLDYLTVPTTEMFRDPEYFLALRKIVVPFLRTYPSLKIWIAGCSTGEEVYSMAILLQEEGLLKKTIFYATDINPHSLEKAKNGIYSVAAIQKASTNYRKAGGTKSLADYYNAAYGAAQFDRRLTKNVVFSDHSLATDAVFAEVHLVSCRNVLIYFDRVLQDRAVGLFCDSLVRQGFLGLGPKESLHFSRHKDAFASVVKHERIYRKR